MWLVMHYSDGLTLIVPTGTDLEDLPARLEGETVYIEPVVFGNFDTAKRYITDGLGWNVEPAFNHGGAAHTQGWFYIGDLDARLPVKTESTPC